MNGPARPEPGVGKDGRRSLGQRMRRSLGRSMPRRESLASHRLLRPVAGHLLSPDLWRLHHEAVARAVAIGTFWAFAMPLGQILIAAVHCIWWRANIPVAMAMTLLTNPLTLGFWLWLAYETGSLIIDAPPLVMPGEGTSVRQWLQAVGGPVALGMGVFALSGAAVGYALVQLGWRLRQAWKACQEADGSSTIER